MREVDAKLKSGNMDIEDRPIHAVGEVSTRLGGITIPMGGSSDWLPPEVKRNAPLGDAIHRWYDETYGDRLKVDMCPGRAVVLVDGDLYVLRVPRMFGSVEFVVSRDFIPETGIGRGPTKCNVVQLLENMRPGKADALSDAAMQAIVSAFETALPAAYTLECTDHELMAIARTDVQVAVVNLMDQHHSFGASKWASLQAAEKVLKAAIALKGAQFKKSHHLSGLCKHLEDLGVTFDHAQLIADIQCSPDIRYGNEPCTRDQALAAHRASLELVNRLRDAGAGFELGLG